MIKLLLLLVDEINRFLAWYILYLQPILCRHEKSEKNIENSRCAQNSLAFESERTATNRRSLVWQRTRRSTVVRITNAFSTCVRGVYACVYVTRRAHLRHPLFSSHSRSPSLSLLSSFLFAFLPASSHECRVAASLNVWYFLPHTDLG